MRFPLGIIFVLLFAASLWQSSNQLVQARELGREEATAPFLGEYKNSVIDLVMFGHRRLYDDLVYLWLIQYIVEDKVVASDYHKDFERIKNIVRLGPKIETVYPLSCFVLAYDYKKPQDCHFITVRGLEFFPRGLMFCDFSGCKALGFRVLPRKRDFFIFRPKKKKNISFEEK